MSEEKAVTESNPTETKKDSSFLDEYNGDEVAYLKALTQSKSEDIPLTKEEKTPALKVLHEQEEISEEISEKVPNNIGDSNQFKEPTYSRTEEEAKRKGWVPKESYKGDPESWLPAAQYMKNWSFINQLKTQDSTIRNLTKKLDTLINVQQSQSKIFVEKHAEEVKKRLDKAVEEGNLNEIRKYDKEYSNLTESENKTMEDSNNYTEKPQIPIEALEFKARNPWFNDPSPMNAAMTVYATQIEKVIEEQHPDWSLKRCLGEVELAVKREFSTFHNPARDEYSPVESKSTRKPKVLESISFNELPEHVKTIVRSVVENSRGKITTEQCIKNFISKGVIKVS